MEVSVFSVLQYFFIVIQFLILMAGVFGNIFVVFVIFSDKKLRSVPNFTLIANISIADIFASIMMPFKIKRVRKFSKTFSY